MASVSKQANGTWRLDFKGLDGKRRAIRLGECPQRFADTFKGHVEQLLVAAAMGQSPAIATAHWVAALNDETHAKLVAAELAMPREDATSVNRVTFIQVAKDYLAKRQDLAEASRIVVSQVVRNIETYFGDKPLVDVTAGDADDFVVWLKTKARTPKYVNADTPGLSLATVGKRLQWCRTICDSARRHKLIVENPFQELKGYRASNDERQVYIPAEHIERIIGIVSEPEWKLMLALARYLGVRVPSEVFTLTWDCIDWERSRIKIISPKTAKIGKPFRWAPILPQIRPHLDLVFEQAAEGETHVFAGLKQRKSGDTGLWKNVNLRTRFEKLIERAGLVAWPKLFVNLRSSAETDLEKYFPLKAVCDWLGNTEAVARKHYLQTIDEDFERAASPEYLTKSAPQRVVKSVVNLAGTEPHQSEPNPVKQRTPGFPGVLICSVEAGGIEPPS